MERKKYRTGYDMVLPREAIEGNKEVQEMLEKVWNKILEDKEHSLSKGFGRVVHIDKDTLKELKEAIEAENMEKVESIVRELKYGKYYEFGSGKGIFRVSDIHSDSVEGIMAELRIEGSAEGRVVIELKTNEEPEIFRNIWSEEEDKVHPNWHWPYTGTGFVATRNGEILPEYYLSWSADDGAFEKGAMGIEGIRLEGSNGEIASFNWGE